MENNAIRPMGDLKKALSGDYQLDIKEVLNEAWQLTKHTKLPLLQALVAVFLFALSLAIAMRFVMGDGFQPMEDAEDNLLLNLVVTVLVSPLVAGLMMMGVKNAIATPAKMTDVYSCLPQSAFIAIASLLETTLANLGMALFILPGIYLLVAMSFTFPLIAEKKLMPFQAIVTSLRVVTYQWFKFFAIYAFFGFLAVLCVATLGFALIWVAPFFYNTKGVIYRRVFGVVALNELQDEETEKMINDDQDTFGA